MSKKLITSLLGHVVLGGALAHTVYKKQKDAKRYENNFERYKSYYQLTSQWLVNKNEGYDIKKYFDDNNIKSVAVYGMGTLSDLLYDDLKKAGIKVCYFIDKKADELYYGIDDLPVIGLEEAGKSEEAVDAIIVTPIYDYEDIYKDLMDIGIETEIISLESIIMDM